MQGKDSEIAAVFSACLHDGDEKARRARGDAVSHVKNPTRRLVLAAVHCSGRALKHASEQFKGDREAVLAAVKQYGYALHQASQQLRSDRGVVLAAVKQNGDALCYASQQLRSDREVVLATRNSRGKHTWMSII